MKPVVGLIVKLRSGCGLNFDKIDAEKIGFKTNKKRHHVTSIGTA